LVRYSPEPRPRKVARAIQEARQHPLILRYKQEVERRLHEVYSTDGWIASAANESIQAGGKRLRPVLAVLTCEAVCGTPNPAFPVAVAYELAHSASLVQDDIIDDSDLRHSSPTAFKRYGLARAIMLSDSMIFEIFSVLTEYQSMNLSKQRLVKLLELLGSSASLAAEGELLEVALSRRGDIKTAEYLKAISQKTGALFAASSASGAVVAGADDETVERMHEFGLSLGIGFQIGDDILDMAGSAESTGKPTFKDMENNAGNVIILHALSVADPFQRNIINSLLFKKWYSALEVERLLSLLQELGSFHYAQSLLEVHTNRCRLLLETLRPSQAKAALEELVRSVEARTV
jgi:geranylgeranyl pyrophosphate synthase